MPKALSFSGLCLLFFIAVIYWMYLKYGVPTRSSTPFSSLLKWGPCTAGVSTRGPLEIFALSLGPGDGYTFNFYLALFGLWVSVQTGGVRVAR